MTLATLYSNQHANIAHIAGTMCYQPFFYITSLLNKCYAVGISVKFFFFISFSVAFCLLQSQFQRTVLSFSSWQTILVSACFPLFFCSVNLLHSSRCHLMLARCLLSKIHYRNGHYTHFYFTHNIHLDSLPLSYRKLLPQRKIFLLN